MMLLCQHIPLAQRWRVIPLSVVAMQWARSSRSFDGGFGCTRPQCDRPHCRAMTVIFSKGYPYIYIYIYICFLSCKYNYCVMCIWVMRYYNDIIILLWRLSSTKWNVSICEIHVNMRWLIVTLWDVKLWSWYLVVNKYVYLTLMWQ